MGDHCEVIPLRPESRTEKVQSKYVGRDQFQKCQEYRDFRTNLSKNLEKKLENGLSESKTGRRLRTTDFCLGARFLRFCTLYLEHGKLCAEREPANKGSVYRTNTQKKKTGSYLAI